MRFTISPKTQNLVCARTGRVGQAQKGLPPTDTEATERARSNTEQASRTNVNGQCEVLAKCERDDEVTTERGEEAPRPDANDGEKGDDKPLTMLYFTYKPFSEE